MHRRCIQNGAKSLLDTGSLCPVTEREEPMFIESYPKFERDMILKAEMLENIKNYPRNLVHLLYQKYSDGILCGTGIQVVEDKNIVVEPGLVKYKGIIYYHTTKEIILCEPLGIEQILVVHFEEQADNINDITYTTQFLLKKDGKVEENEMELCRFILKEGAVLRKDYQDLRDMATLHNTVNIILTPFAGIGSATLSPEITYRFGQEMMKFKLTDAFDVSFVMHCMQQETIQKEVIEQYVRCHVPNAERGSLSQKQLHHYLTVIVDDTKRGGNRGGMMPGGTRRMLVD